MFNVNTLAVRWTVTHFVDEVFETRTQIVGVVLQLSGFAVDVVAFGVRKVRGLGRQQSQRVGPGQQQRPSQSQQLVLLHHTHNQSKTIKPSKSETNQ